MPVEETDERRLVEGTLVERYTKDTVKKNRKLMNFQLKV